MQLILITNVTSVSCIGLHATQVMLFVAIFHDFFHLSLPLMMNELLLRFLKMRKLKMCPKINAWKNTWFQWVFDSCSYFIGILVMTFIMQSCVLVYVLISFLRIPQFLHLDFPLSHFCFNMSVSLFSSVWHLVKFPLHSTQISLRALHEYASSPQPGWLMLLKNSDKSEHIWHVYCLVLTGVPICYLSPPHIYIMPPDLQDYKNLCGIWNL